MAGQTQAEIVWRPQAGPQAALVKCPVYEILFGGARGGGKTDGMIGGDWPIHAQQYGQYAKGIFFRRELPQLEAAIERSKEIYFRLGAEWNEQKKTWRFPNGALLKFRPLERDSDAEKYQGHDYTRVYFEELTNYPDPKPVMKIKGTLRSGHGVPVGFRATANPGGPGHNWVKARYIDPAPGGWEIIKDDNGLSRVFIPSRLTDNKILTTEDPLYVARLKETGSEQLVKAWLEGDWNVIDGAFFDCWSQDMILRPFTIPDHWTKFVSFDWGSARPFSVGWWAVASEDCEVPKGSLIRYREWYGMKPNSPNVGLKLTAEQVGQGIKSRQTETINYYIADPAIFAEDGGPSIAERMRIPFSPADNKRVSARGAMGGWDQMRNRMVGEDDKPMLYVFSTCKDSIRTIPVLQHDQNRPEDLDTSAEDHCFAAGTLVDTPTGQVPIEKLPETGYVFSKDSVQAYRSARLTRKNTETVKLKFSNGAEVVCTPEHRFMLESNEWRYANLLEGEYIKCRSLSLVRQSKNSTAIDTICAENTSKEREFGCIEKCGNTIMGRYLRMPTYITLTRTLQTIKSLILNAFPCAITYQIDTKNRALSTDQRAWIRRGERLLSGMEQKKGESGTLNTLRKILGMRTQKKRLQKNAKSVGKNTSRLSPGLTRANSAIQTAEPVRCVSVEKWSNQDVYCLTVPENETFSIEGGLLVHNCADEWRYACMSRPYSRPLEADETNQADDYGDTDDDGDDSWMTT